MTRERCNYDSIFVRFVQAFCRLLATYQHHSFLFCVKSARYFRKVSQDLVNSYQSDLVQTPIIIIPSHSRNFSLLADRNFTIRLFVLQFKTRANTFSLLPHSFRCSLRSQNLPFLNSQYLRISIPFYEVYILCVVWQHIVFKRLELR